AVVFLLAGGARRGVAEPAPRRVVGPRRPTPAAAPATGDATAGAALFKSNGCGGCHKFTPAGTNGTVGPDLDKLSQYAQQANQGSEVDFIHESIANPSSYIQPPSPNSLPTFTMPATHIPHLLP